MEKLRGRGPGRKLSTLIEIFRKDEFNNGLPRSRARLFGEKNRTVIGAS
jgi:hypothetical protein